MTLCRYCRSAKGVDTTGRQNPWTVSDVYTSPCWKRQRQRLAGICSTLGWTQTEGTKLHWEARYGVSLCSKKTDRFETLHPSDWSSVTRQGENKKLCDHTCAQRFVARAARFVLLWLTHFEATSKKQHSTSTTKLNISVSVIYCDFGVVCFNVHGSKVGCAGCWYPACESFFFS